jgi:hypothetical protein
VIQPAYTVGEAAVTSLHRAHLSKE